MSNVLLIEPYKILQQAIALSLISDHQVQIRESVSPAEVGALKDSDLLIIDAASLEEKKLLTTELVRALQSCAAPILWLEDEKPLERPKTGKFEAIKKPLEQKAFKEALSSLLAVESRAAQEPGARRTTTPKSDPAKAHDRIKAAGAAKQSSFDFIDLVEVVEDPPSEGGDRTSKKGT